MAKQLQLRQGTTLEHNSFTGAVGEVTVDTTKDVLVVHDGITAGGFPNAARANTDGTISLIKKDGTSAGEVNSAGLFNNTLTSTNANQALTAAQGKALSDTMFGVNQTWGSYTTLRASNTIYTNTTGRPITVNIILHDRNDSSAVFVEVEGLNIGYLSNSMQYGQAKTLSFIVPNGSIYKVIGTFNGWMELR